jgi:Skp family chaperone for outer membrane proteins
VLMGSMSGLLAEATLSAQDKDAGKLVSIDSILLMQKSKEGQKLGEKIQKDVEEFQKFAKNAQKELTDYQESVSKQAKVLSKDALVEKGEKLAKMKKDAERSLEDKETELKHKIQREQVELRNRQMKVANEVFEQKKWGLAIDAGTPGLLFVSKAVDKTDEILKVVDERFEKETKTIAEPKKVKETKGA